MGDNLMTKEDVEKKIKEILDKDPRYKDAVVKIKFIDKSSKIKK